MDNLTDFISQKRLFAFDLDGCVYTGDQPVPGVAEFIKRLEGQGARVVFVSNNSTHTGEQISQKLAGFGVSTTPENIFHPAGFAGEFLKEQGVGRVFVAGSRALLQNVEQAGAELCGTGETDCAAVLIGRDTDFTYARFEAACRYIQRGARFFVTNIDISHPSAGGVHVPEAGVFAAAIEQVCGKKVEKSIGKPTAFLYNKLMEKNSLAARDCVMLGDNPDTDIKGAANAGMDSIQLVMPGGFPKGAPTFWVDGFGRLIESL